MAELDASTLAQRACMLGLLTDSQVQECFADTDCQPGSAAALLRVMERKGYLTSWQSTKLARGETDGYFVGGYRLLYKIASGSFGRVFRAVHPRGGAVVALKVLRNRWTDNAHSVESFEREGKVGLTLKHPNIVQILAVDRDAATKQHYIVMEFVEGGSLKDFLGIRRKLEAAEALRLIEDAAAGLAYAYTRGLTHRDLKPTNMLISSQGAIKLVDFGLAGMFSSSNAGAFNTTSSRDEEGKVERTVDYAGLEKATGVRPGDVRSDIYFLGCVLYEMLTGRPPLPTTKDKNARMEKKRFETVPPMTTEEVKAPPSVFRLVDTMMALEPMARHQTPAQLVEAIREVRRELAGGKPAAAAAAPGAASEAPAPTGSVFVVEENLKIQDAIRTKFKELGWRVLLSAEPARALQRFQQMPYDALIVDAGSTGDLGLVSYRQIMEEAAKRQHGCVGVLILNEDQRDFLDRLILNPRMAVLFRPITLRQLYTKICELMTPGSG